MNKQIGLSPLKNSNGAVKALYADLNSCMRIPRVDVLMVVGFKI